MQQALLGLIRDGKIKSAHDLSEGGLFVALFESASVSGLGFDAYATEGMRADGWWFGEAQGRVIVTVSAGQGAALEQFLGAHKVSCTRVGTVTDGELRVNGSSWGRIDAWKARYDTAIESHMAAYHSE